MNDFQQYELDLSGKKMTYKEFRAAEAGNDIKAIKAVIRPKWYENIFLFGALLYAIRIAIKANNVEYNPLRKKIVRNNGIALCSLLIYGYLLCTVLTPWLHYAIYSKSVKSVQSDIADQAL